MTVLYDAVGVDDRSNSVQFVRRRLRSASGFSRGRISGVSVCVVQILCAIPGIPKTRVVTALVFTGVQPCALILLCEFYPWCKGPARARRHVSSPSGKYIKENSVETSSKERVYSSTPVCPSGVVSHRGRARNGFDSSDDGDIHTVRHGQTDRQTKGSERQREQ